MQAFRDWSLCGICFAKVIADTNSQVPAQVLIGDNNLASDLEATAARDSWPFKDSSAQVS